MNEHNTPRVAEDDALPSLSVGHIFGRGLSAYKQHFLSLTLISIIGHLPVIALVALVAGEVVEYSPLVIVAMAVLVLFLESLLVLLFCRAAWDALAGRPLSIGAVWEEVRPRFWAGLGTGLFVGLCVVIGTFLLVIPGVIVGVISWVAVPVCLIENKGPIQSFTRSRELLRGYGWTIFFVILLIGLFDQVPDRIMGKMLENDKLGLDVYLLVTLGLSIVVAPIRACLTVAAYRDAVEISKDRDIEAIAQVFGDREAPGLLETPLYGPEDDAEDARGRGSRRLDDDA